MKKNCLTCEFRFPPQGDRLEDEICAGEFYGKYIGEIEQSDDMECWSISLDDFIEQEENK